MTVVIQIGNSDNKLSQNDWSMFILSVGILVERNCQEIHFKGGSCYTSPWQNACWVCSTYPESLGDLIDGLKRLTKQFNQDSIAVTTGDTQFISGE